MQQQNGGHVNGMPYINDSPARESANFFGCLDPQSIPPGRAVLPFSQSAPFMTHVPYPAHHVGHNQPYSLVGHSHLSPSQFFHHHASPYAPAHLLRDSPGDRFPSSPSPPVSQFSSPGYMPNHLPPVSPSPPPMEHLFYPDAGHFLREEFQIPDGVPIDLDALPHPDNPDKRPPYTLNNLAQLAIYSYPRHKATLHEIRTAIQDRFSFFKGSNQKKFNGSLRHLLSFHSIFAKLPRHPTEPGPGEYWTLDITHAFETKRPRKRRNAKGKVSTSQAHVRRSRASCRGSERHQDFSSRSSSSSHMTDTPEPDVASADLSAGLRRSPPPGYVGDGQHAASYYVSGARHGWHSERNPGGVSSPSSGSHVNLDWEEQESKPYIGKGKGRIP